MSVTHSYKLRVAAIRAETEDARSIVLEPEEGDAERFSYRPGQFLTINVPTDREGGAARCYSLSSSPLLREPMQVTVKRTGEGYGSNWLCDNLNVGDELEVLRPSGMFTPSSLDADLLLVAAGSGITPMMSILKSVLHGGTGRVALIYANRDEQSVIFGEELLALQGKHPDRLHTVHLLESVQGLPSMELLREHLRPYRDREMYVCGPQPYMAAVTAAAAAAGVAAERVRQEKFFSLDTDPFAEPRSALDHSGPSATVEVQLEGETQTVSCPKGERMLDAFLEAGVDAPFSCREGNCSACACFVLEGEVEMLRNEVLEPEDLADGIVLACQSVPLSDHLRVSYDE
ncbi:ferredoxin--NADP reductase [Sciscionella marina]|uniref:ferredoxin--NADP reductase n=1 Tax=Sciscionella marina TaxID=508770 RepID=UPI00035EC30C|nr:ferredoxin--NADP reductase [Sciscionella marina]